MPCHAKKLEAARENFNCKLGKKKLHDE